jgi:predicted nucleotidyltransferase
MSALDRVRALAAAQPELALLVLYGSRGRGTPHAQSDWDFGYLAGPGFDPPSFLAGLVGTLGCERVDLVDLARASGQLRYRAAAEGVVVAERDDAFGAFWSAAVHYWLDMQDVLRAEYTRALERLSP